jgi:hypothetical protein
MPLRFFRAAGGELAISPEKYRSFLVGEFRAAHRHSIRGASTRFSAVFAVPHQGTIESHEKSATA